MNTINTPAARYSMGAIVLHWLMAILIVGNWFIPIVTEDMAKPTHEAAMGWHKAIGLSVLFLAILRIVWRIVAKPPELESTLQPWERMLAKAVHALFYFLIVAIPLTGWLMVSAFMGEGTAANIFGVQIPVLPVGKSESGAGIAHEVHEILAFAFAGLWVLHVAAALKHQFIDRDGTLARMMPAHRR